MEIYRSLLFLHIAAVVFGMGITFVLPFLQAFAESHGVGAARFYFAFLRRLQHVALYPSWALLLGFGIALIFTDATGYSDDFPHWLGGAIAWFVVLIGFDIVVMGGLVREAERILNMVPEDAPLPPAYREVSRRLQIYGGLEGLSVLGILFLMVWGAEGGFR
ncbi:MAG: DUF2269 family protein [Dehalococcoidia bacterium]